MKPSVQLNTAEFERTLKQYISFSKKELAFIINQKSLQVATAANRMTSVGRRSTITQQANEMVQGRRIRFKGKNHDRKQPPKPAPRLALILNRRTKDGEGLYGPRMAEAFQKELEFRRKGIYFLSSGWLPSVAIFAKATNAKPGANATRRLASVQSRPGLRTNIGGAIPAAPGTKAQSMLFHEAFSKFTSNAQGAESVVKGALQRAIDQWTASMRVYVERKMQAMTDRVVGRFFR